MGAGKDGMDKRAAPYICAGRPGEFTPLDWRDAFCGPCLDEAEEAELIRLRKRAEEFGPCQECGSITGAVMDAPICKECWDWHQPRRA
jgi:hypothetical protein